MAERKRAQSQRKRLNVEAPNTNRWLITYTDLCTLLMTFFVLLVSMSALDHKRERKALDSLAGSFGYLTGGTSKDIRKEGQSPLSPKNSATPGRSMDIKMLRELALSSNLGTDQVTKERDKIVLQINQKVLFHPGSTELLPEIKGYLTSLATYLARGEKDVEIRGHTDIYEGVHEAGWPDRSWDLSAKRALAVYSFFQNRGLEAKRMSSHGFSYHRPLVSSLEFPQLSEKNQRVEIVIGPNDSIPSDMLQQQRKANPYFNYKNFFFRLYPMPEHTPAPEEDKRPDIYE